MEIRPFSEQDTEAVVGLWRECGLIVPWNDPYKDIRRKMSVDPDLFLVGREKDRIVATAMGGYEGHRGWINYLAVAPGYRGQGRGRSLVVHLERLLAARGCPKINLQIRASNRETAAFYEAMGYRPETSITLGKRLEHDE